MNTTVISVRTNQAVKQRATAVANQFGIPLSTLINAYLHDLAQTGRIYFSTSEVMTPAMEREIERAEREIAAGEVSPTFGSAEKAIAYLKNL